VAFFFKNFLRTRLNKTRSSFPKKETKLRLIVGSYQKEGSPSKSKPITATALQPFTIVENPGIQIINNLDSRYTQPCLKGRLQY